MRPLFGAYRDPRRPPPRPPLTVHLAVLIAVSLATTIAATFALRSIERVETPDSITRPSTFEIAGVISVWLILAALGAAYDRALLVVGPLAVAAWSDERHRIVPDEIIVAALLMVFIASRFDGEEVRAVSGLISAGSIAFSFFVVGELIKRPLLGLGDVKFLLVVGAALGPVEGPVAFGASAFIGFGRIVVAARQRRVAMRDVGAFAHAQNLWWGIPVAAGIDAFARP